MDSNPLSEALPPSVRGGVSALGGVLRIARVPSAHLLLPPPLIGDNPDNSEQLLQRHWTDNSAQFTVRKTIEKQKRQMGKTNEIRLSENSGKLQQFLFCELQLPVACHSPAPPWMQLLIFHHIFADRL